MQLIKTISQGNTIYQITKYAEDDFRITYSYPGESKVYSLHKVYDSAETCEQCIEGFRKIDAALMKAEESGKSPSTENNIKRFVVKVNRKTQQDILEHLYQIDNIQTYLISLIRQDMESRSINSDT